VALEVNPRAPEVLGETLGEIERARPAGVVSVELLQLLLEGGVGLGVLPGAPELQDQRHQRLGDEAAAELAEEAMIVGAGSMGIELRRLGLLFLRCHALRTPKQTRRHSRAGGNPCHLATRVRSRRNIWPFLRGDVHWVPAFAGMTPLYALCRAKEAADEF